MSQLHPFAKTTEEQNAFLDDGYDVNLAVSLIKVRTGKGMSQNDLASLLEVSQSYISQLESGNVLPSHTQLKRIARLLKCKLSAPQLSL